jgi:hypothetical protein
MRHATLDLKWQREGRSGHGPHPRGSVGRHLAETKGLPPERHDSSCMVLPEDFRQGEPDSLEAPQHHPMIVEDPLLLCLRGAI